MEDDILKPFSQRDSGEETAKNRRIHEIADGLRRGCQLYETQFRDGQGHVNSFEIEQRVAKKFAKDNNLWLPMSDVFTLGGQVQVETRMIHTSRMTLYTKVNNPLNSGSIIRLLEKIVMHNDLFYDTAYSLYAFTGFDGRTIMPVLQQRLVKKCQTSYKH